MELTTKTFKRSVRLSPGELGNIDQNLLKNLRRDIEQKCQNGSVYIANVKGITSRTEGCVDNSNFSETKFEITFLADVYEPMPNDIIFSCKIIEIKGIGIILRKDNIANIIVQNSFLPSDYEKKFKIGQTLNIRILSCQCMATRDHINVVGQIHYYYVPETKFLQMNLHTTVNPLEKLDISFREKKEELENIYQNIILCDKVNRIKHEIDNIDPQIWDYYKMLLNPYELIYPKVGYANEEKAIYQGKRVPSRAYFKFLEISNQVKGISQFMRQKDLKISCLAEAPGGFIRAIEKKIGIDNIQTIYSISQGNENALKYSEDLLTINFKDAKKVKITYGNLFVQKDVEQFVASAKGSQLITADGGISTKDVDYDQEKELFRLIIAEVYVSFLIAKEGSSLILKIFDINTKAMIDLIWLLCSYYNNVNIYKPQMSRPANSERYLICSDFKGKVSKDVLTSLKGVVFAVGNQYINGILPNLQNNPLYVDFYNRLRGYGYRLSEMQYKKIREILEIIKIHNFQKPKPEVVEEYMYYQRLFGEEWARHNYLKED